MTPPFDENIFAGNIRRRFFTDTIKEFIVDLSCSVEQFKNFEKWASNHLLTSQIFGMNLPGQTNIVSGWIILSEYDAAILRMHTTLSVK